MLAKNTFFVWACFVLNTCASNKLYVHVPSRRIIHKGCFFSRELSGHGRIFSLTAEEFARCGFDVKGACFYCHVPLVPGEPCNTRRPKRP